MLVNVEFVVYPRRGNNKIKYNGAILYNNTLVVDHRHIFHIPPKINIFDYNNMGILTKIERAA